MRPPTSSFESPAVVAALRALPPNAQLSDPFRNAAVVVLRVSTREHEALATLFEDATTLDDRRLLVLDLLAAAGTFEAQVVMRRLLSNAVARRDSRVFAAMVQRLGFVAAPDGATLRFLMSVYAESKNEPHDVRAACAYVLGVAAGKATEDDTPARATEVLRRDLRASRTPVEQCFLLRSLGNAGLAVDAHTVLRFSRSDDPTVRAAAALAMRKIATPDGRVALIGLLADPDPKVAENALLSLADVQLEEHEIERLGELILGGRTTQALDAAILRLLLAQKRVNTTRCIEQALLVLLARVPLAASTHPPAEISNMMFHPTQLAAGNARRFPSASNVPVTRGSSQPPRPSNAPTMPPPPPHRSPALPFSGAYRIVPEVEEAPPPPPAVPRRHLSSGIVPTSQKPAPHAPFPRPPIRRAH